METKPKEKKIEITPTSLRCIAAACPAIFKTNKGTYVVIGKKLTKEELTEEIKNKVGKGEMVIEVPKELFSEL